MGWQRKLLSNSLWMFVGLLLGRLAGFAREMFLAARFGAGAEADIAILMLTLPDLLVNILVGGAMSVALIPAFKRYGAGPRAYCLFAQSSVAVALLFSLVALLAMLFVVPLIGLVAPGFSSQQVSAAAPLLEWVFWLIPLTVLAGVSTAFLQANDRFAVTAFNTFSFNAVVLLGLGYSIASGGTLQQLALFILAAGLLRWLIQLLVLPRPRLSWRCFRWRLLDRKLLTRYMHAMMAGGLLLLLPVIARAMASLHGEGGLSLFNYAMKLVEFPLGLGVMVLSVGIFPLLSHCFSRNEESCAEMVATGVQVVLLITVAMMLPLAWFAGDFAALIFGHGAMGREEVVMVGSLLALGVLSLPLQGVASIFTATYNAARDTAFILWLNLLAAVLFALLGYWGVRLFGLQALMVSLVVVFGVLLTLQWGALRRRLSLQIGALLWRKRVIHSMLLMVLAGLLPLLLLQGLQLGNALNVVGAILVGGIMLIVGMVSGGSHRNLLAMITKRVTQ